jgi:hypothetical protein
MTGWPCDRASSLLHSDSLQVTATMTEGCKFILLKIGYHFHLTAARRLSMYNFFEIIQQKLFPLQSF